jgi:outer membrane protein assembly factor BamB
MKVHRKCWLTLGLLCLSFVSVFVSGENWSRFRGPDGAGQGKDTAIPLVWTEDDYLWRVELPGIGHSSPVVWEGQVIVSSALEADGTKVIRSLRATDGSLLWETRFQVDPYGLGRSTSHDKASPTVDEERVYLTWASTDQYHVAALDRRSGDEVWRRTLGPFKAEHGAGASPIRFGDLLIVPNDQAGPSSTLALDCETGETRWSVDRRSGTTAYSTPALYRPNGGAAELILASSTHGVSSLDPDTGRLNWELPDVFGKVRVTGSPVVAGGLIFAQCGVGGAGKKMVAVKPPDPASGNTAQVAYEVAGSIPYVPTSVAYGNWLFVWSDSGIVSCIDTRTGERVWRERVGGTYFGSPIRVGNRIYCISREGEVVVLGAQQKFQLLGRTDLEEPSHSTPAVADGVMYLRTFSHLMALAAD